MLHCIALTIVNMHTDLLESSYSVNRRTVTVEGSGRNSEIVSKTGGKSMKWNDKCGGRKVMKKNKIILPTNAV